VPSRRKLNNDTSSLDNRLKAVKDTADKLDKMFREHRGGEIEQVQ
jgi:hypothetical protein